MWNPVTGCTKVSAGCTNCYAERMAKRLAGRAGYPVKDPFAVTLHPDRLDEPLHWRKPWRIFVCSMGDLFHPDVPDDFVDRVWGAMMLAHWHQFLVLTKRPERMNSYLDRKFKRGPDDPRLAGVWPLTGEKAAAAARGGAALCVLCHWPLPNVWLGTSVEDQATADERIPHLLRCPAAVRFVFYEPVLGPVDFMRIAAGALCPQQPEHRVDVLRAGTWEIEGYGFVNHGDMSRLDWVIAGGESGPGARPAHPDWFRSVRHQCSVAGVPFFFKAWGEWTVPNAMVSEMQFVPKFKTGRQHPFDDGPIAQRVGKKAAGRLLDGREHNAHPGEGRS